MTDYTSAEFWDGAPEGATHYRPGVATYYKQTERAFEWSMGRWNLISNDLGEFRWSDQLIDRPTTQPATWNGPEDGLPPVGLVCQVQSEDGDWHECMVLAHHLHNAVFVPHADYPYGVYDGLPVERFRPIRTPEQVAAAEREAAIKEMSEVIKSQFSFGWVFEKLYDAGYRKQDEAK